jgi:aminodeoxyfutalosine deaminase
MSLKAYIARMPKVELHIHLEGSIRPSTLLTLAERNGVELPAQDLAGLREFYKYTDLDHFMLVYNTVCSCLRTPDDLSLIVYEYGAEMARQHVRYAEVTPTPWSLRRDTGLPFETILEALNDGRMRAERDFGVVMRWIFGITRDDVDSRLAVARWAVESRLQGTVALGLGGSESRYPPELFEDAFAYARRGGLLAVPHAGEALGPQAVWTALQRLQADRIGHGVRSIEDPRLVDYLVVRQVPLEICPTSNIRIGLYDSYREHPLPLLWDAGVFVTIHSDDPPMMGTTLNREYEVLVSEWGFDRPSLETIALNAVRASFLASDEKAHLLREFRAELDSLRQLELTDRLGEARGEPT